MPSLSAYKSELDYSYAPGIFPSMECLNGRPDKVRRLLVHSSAVGREGTDRLCALAEKLGVRVEEADRALARISGKRTASPPLCSGNLRMNRFRTGRTLCCTIPGTAGMWAQSCGRPWAWV